MRGVCRGRGEWGCPGVLVSRRAVPSRRRWARRRLRVGRKTCRRCDSRRDPGALGRRCCLGGGSVSPRARSSGVSRCQVLGAAALVQRDNSSCRVPVARAVPSPIVSRWRFLAARESERKTTLNTFLSVQHVVG